jgi:sugar O-acyltransferase (sialic acid O-acetyltransferase NeuD family)
MSEKLIIVGNTSFAEIAYEYFLYDSPYEIVAFSVEDEYIKEKNIFGLPVVAFEQLDNKFSPNNHDIFVAATYTQLNRLRTRLAEDIKSRGYRLASYISSQAFLWRNVELGEHCFIFEDNTIQPFVSIGSNNIIWSGNHIGHHTKIGDNNFISSHVVISGHCNINDNCFFGVNSTLANNLNISDDTLIGAGAVLTKNTKKGGVYIGNPARITGNSSYSAFGIEAAVEVD